MLSNLSNIVARRDLIRELVSSEMKASTAGTRLGWFTWLLDPLVMMLIYWVFIVIIFGRDRYAPYPIFIGCALLAWKHFSSSAGSAVKVLRSKHTLIKSVPFPTMVLPLSQVLTQFTYFCFGMLILLLAAAGFGLLPTLKVIQIVPLMILQIVLITGVSLALASVGVLIRDLETFITHAIRVGWYLSPGIYGVDLVQTRFGQFEGLVSGDTLLTIYMLNPMALLFTGYRAAIYDPEWLSLWHWSVLSLEAALVLMGGYLIYQHFDRRVLKFI